MKMLSLERVAVLLLTNDTIRYEAGNDNLRGEAGNDTIYTGTGSDTVTGGLGDDTIFVDGFWP